MDNDCLVRALIADGDEIDAVVHEFKPSKLGDRIVRILDQTPEYLADLSIGTQPKTRLMSKLSSAVSIAFSIESQSTHYIPGRFESIVCDRSSAERKAFPCSCIRSASMCIAHITWLVFDFHSQSLIAL
jgi:hypothetical protein